MIKAFCSFPSVLGTASTEKTLGKLVEMALVLRELGENFEHGEKLSAKVPSVSGP